MVPLGVVEVGGDHMAVRKLVERGIRNEFICEEREGIKTQSVYNTLGMGDKIIQFIC